MRGVNSALDHLVIAAESLAQGIAWCEATLGASPGPGGRHPLMGTHNRLLRIASPAFPQAYLELIAIDPDAPAPGRVRWFGLDDPALQARLRKRPRLVHAVARTDNLETLRWGLINLAQDPGPPLAAGRDTPEGRLAWRILVRDDGALPGGGRLPTLIQWQGRHPADAMPASPVVLKSVNFGALQLREASLLRLRGATTTPGGPALAVTLATPRGDVHLSAEPDAHPGLLSGHLNDHHNDHPPVHPPGDPPGDYLR